MKSVFDDGGDEYLCVTGSDRQVHEFKSNETPATIVATFLGIGIEEYRTIFNLKSEDRSFYFKIGNILSLKSRTLRKFWLLCSFSAIIKLHQLLKCTGIEVEKSSCNFTTFSNGDVMQHAW